jgi:hypothetical protein
MANNKVKGTIIVGMKIKRFIIGGDDIYVDCGVESS